MVISVEIGLQFTISNFWRISSTNFFWDRNNVPFILFHATFMPRNCSIGPRSFIWNFSFSWMINCCMGLMKFKSSTNIPIITNWCVPSMSWSYACTYAIWEGPPRTWTKEDGWLKHSLVSNDLFSFSFLGLCSSCLKYHHFHVWLQKCPTNMVRRPRLN